MGAFLVTGNPGAGKTALAEELSRRGYAAVDGDELAGWESEAGEEVPEPADPSDAWRLSHRWVWRRRLVKELVRAHAAVGRDAFEHEMRGAGAVALDARLPPAVLADHVLQLALGVPGPESCPDTAVVQRHGPGVRGRT